MKVLVVDDEPRVLTSIEDLLEDEFEVLTTTDAQEALRLLEEQEVAVILSDQRMPGLSGDQFLSRAREVSEAARVLITGYADLGAVTRAVNQSQIYAYLEKPWDTMELRTTVQRAAEYYEMARALRESEERLRGLMERLPEGVCLLDGERRAVLANPAGEAYLRALAGASAGDAVSHIGGRAVEDLLEPRPDGLAHEATTEGARRVFEVELRPLLKGREGEGWVLVMREVTREREAQERMQQQDRLAAVGQLAAGIAHDFNNLLTVVGAVAEMLKMRPDLPDPVKEDLEYIVSQGEQAAQLVQQILDFSRKSVAQREPVDLVGFLREAVRLLDRALPETVRLVAAFGRENPVVEASPTQLQQVITNLAVNARDAMPEGGELRIGLSSLRVARGERPPLPEMGPGDWVVWTVSDTGTGMPPEVMEHIFEPFFTTKDPGQGTGLGLAQVYGIVKQHGGEIGVESHPGEGTTFTIYLPRMAEAEAPPRPQKAEVPKGRGETILVAEDQPEVRHVIRSMLERLNYRVLTAMDGQEALEVYDLHRDEIALVLTDMVMPEMGGGELFEALRERDAGVRVVAMTGYPLGRGGQMPEGVGGRLEKPLNLARVAQVIREALGREL
jgi:signal transduction histidine kinase